MFVKPRTIWKKTPNRKYISIMSNLPLAPGIIMKIVKRNCAKSNRRTGKCICKKAKLYYTTFFAFFLDNYIFCKNQDINGKRIVGTSHVEDWIKISVKFYYYIRTSFLIFSANRKAFFLVMETLG